MKKLNINLIAEPLDFKDQISIQNIMNLLIDRNCGINFKFNEGNTLLHLACKFGLATDVKILLDNNANINSSL